MDKYKLWIDIEDILGGEQWRNTVGEALDNSTCLLLILSPNSTNSSEVNREYTYALTNKLPIIVIQHNEVKKLGFGIHDLQIIDFTHQVNVYDSYGRLKRALTKSRVLPEEVIAKGDLSLEFEEIYDQANNLAIPTKVTPIILITHLMKKGYMTNDAFINLIRKIHINDDIFKA
jgi:hypothetical protein